jgi:hypothetical protein
MVLLSMIICIPVRPMYDALSELRFARTRGGTVPIGRDPSRNTVRHHPRRTQACLSHCLILPLTEENIHQVAVPINGPVEVASAAFHLEIQLLALPTLSTSPAAIFAQGALSSPAPAR